MERRALVVADDLTGAADAGDRFAARGYDTRVATAAADDAGDAAVLVRDTGSRGVDPETAADRVGRAVATHDAPVVYKKVDSTLRGHLAVEIDAAVAASDADLAVVAPAFPDQGRHTAGGHHLVDGTPVHETPAGRDPDGPTTSHLPTVLEGSAHPVVRLSLDVVSAGSAAVADALSARLADQSGPALMACDTTRTAHLDAVAAGAAAVDGAVVYAGSAGLAGHVRLGEGAGVLGAVGSTTPTAFEQLDALPDAVVVAVEAPLDAATSAVANRLAATLGDEGRAVVTAARSPADRESTLAAGRDRGLRPPAVADRVAALLGGAVAATVRRTPVGGLFLTGGDTAAAGLDALDVTGVELAGRSVAAGVPVGRVAGGPADGTPVVTKAGAFGGPETTVNCLSHLAASDG